MKNNPWTMATSVMHRSARLVKRPAAAVMASDCNVSREQLPVERLDVVDEALEPVSREHGRPSPLAHRASSRVIAEQRLDGVRQPRRIVVRRNEAYRLAGRRRGLEDVADAAHVGGDARHGGGEALDERNRRALVAGGEQEDVGGAVHDIEVPTPAEKTHAICEAETAGGLLERGAQFAVAGDQEDRVGVEASDEPRGLEEEA